MHGVRRQELGVRAARLPSEHDRWGISGPVGDHDDAASLMGALGVLALERLGDRSAEVD